MNRQEVEDTCARRNTPEGETDRLRALSIFKEALENATDAIGMSTPEGRHYYQNRAFTALFGDVGENPAAEIYCDEAVGREVFETLMAGGTWTGEVEMYARDRRVRSILLRSYAIKDEHGTILALVGIHTDMTDRKRADEAIRENEVRLRALSDNLPGGLVYQIDSGPDGTERRFTYLSDGVEELHQVSAAAAMQDPMLIYAQVDEEDLRRVAEREAEALRLLSPLNIEVHVTLPSGERRCRLFTSAPRRLSNGRLVWDGVELDITDRKVVEQRCRSTIESSPAGMHFYRLESDDRLVFVGANPAADKLLGIENAQFIGKTIEEAFPPLATTEIPALYRRVAATGEKWEAGEIAYDHGGIEGFYSVIAFQIEPRHMAALFFDVTDRKRSQEAQRRIAILESLGNVAGGIAHDFNNLLMGVFCNIELAALSLPAGHPALAPLKAADQVFDIARRLTTRLLTFAKGGSPVLEAVDLQQGLRDTVQFHLAGSNVAAQFDIPADIWPAKADKGQMAEVVSNLTVNAKEAMPSGGTLHVQARNVPDIHDDAAPELRGDYVRLTFRDEGVGIPATLLPRIFDPYFTTKQAGSGLGLAVVHGIVTRHKGHVAVESAPNEGTTFTILLPADTAARPQTAAVQTPSADTSPRGRGRVLVMDDEPMVRRIASRMLVHLGYAVETANDGRETVEMYSAALRDGKPFDLAILDLTVPGGMGGKEAIQELRAIDPSVKAIVASGYSSDPVLSSFDAFGFSGRLTKPFALDELKEALSLALKKT